MPRRKRQWTKEEAAEWFDTHDTGPYLDQWETVKVKFNPKKIRHKRLTMTLPASLCSQLDRLARRERISRQVLVERLLHEAIRHELEKAM